MDILKMISGQMIDQDVLNQLGQAVGAKPNQVKQVAHIGMPPLLQALRRNAATSEGAAALAGALDQHKDDNINDVARFLNNIDNNDSARMLQHIFSGNTERVQSNLARQTGLDKNQVSGLMMKMAPLLMGALGQHKKQQNIDAASLSGMLSGLFTQGSSGMMGMVANLLDTDNDGDITDDIGKILGGFLKK